MEPREKIQLGLALTLVLMAISVPTAYIVSVGISADNEIVKTIVIGSYTLVVAGAGAAFSLFGLGRKVKD